MSALNVVEFIDAGGFMPESKCFVLQTANKSYFREWLRLKAGPEFRFVGHLSCARAFLDKQLAESFQKFLHEHGHKTSIFEVEHNRLIRQSPTFEPLPPEIVKVWRPKTNQKGFALLLELMVCLLVLSVVFAMAAPNIQTMRRFAVSQAAKERVLQVRNAEITLVTCAATNCNLGLVSALIPPVGSQIAASYIYTFSQPTASTWSYTATPMDPGCFAWFVDETGQLRGAVGTADQTSQTY